MKVLCCEIQWRKSRQQCWSLYPVQRPLYLIREPSSKNLSVSLGDPGGFFMRSCNRSFFHAWQPFRPVLDVHTCLQLLPQFLRCSSGVQLNFLDQICAFLGFLICASFLNDVVSAIDGWDLYTCIWFSWYLFWKLDLWGATFSLRSWLSCLGFPMISRAKRY